MPNLASFHPQIVHFVVALLFLGVALRLVSLTGRLRFTDSAAATLLIIGASASWFAVKSGTDAHGPVERIPGTRDMVIRHEEGGKTTRNIFLAVGAIELLALGLARRQTLLRNVRYAHFASAALGIFGASQLYETAEHGGELVYSYAGGPGLRTGDPKDVERLLLAGLYNQSREDRKSKRFADAAGLVAEMRRRFPNDTNVRFLGVESLMDRKDYRGVLTAVDSMSFAATDARNRARQATFRADAWLALNKPDSARAALAPVVTAFPQNTRLKAKLDSIK